MKNNSLVSVIIPVYNGERYLAEAIESALGQTYRPIEIIVVDDGSTDNTAQVARRFGAPVHYYRQNHAGIGGARNRGTEAAHGQVLAFLDADDLWVESKLTRQMAALGRDPRPDIVFGQVRNFRSSELSEELKKQIRCPEETMPGYFPSTMLVRREAFFRVGPFEISWNVGEFIDWYAKAMETGLKTVLLPEVLAARRLHAANQGLLERNSQADYVRILKTALDRRRSAARGGGDGSAKDDEPKG